MIQHWSLLMSLFIGSQINNIVLLTIYHYEGSMKYTKQKYLSCETKKLGQ